MSFTILICSAKLVWHTTLPNKFGTPLAVVRLVSSFFGSSWEELNLT
jgi:hypothetical protein